jgi:hypothetical protein
MIMQAIIAPEGISVPVTALLMAIVNVGAQYDRREDSAHSQRKG